MQIEIQFKTELQKHIADLIWKAKGIEVVQDIKKVYGVEADIVFNMILAHIFDEEMDTNIADILLEDIKNR